MYKYGFLFAVCCFLNIAIAQTSSLNILWDPNSEPDIDKYKLQRAVNSTTSFSDFTEVSHPQTSASDNSVTPGNLYAYRIAAINDAGMISTYSSPVLIGIPGIQLTISTISTGSDTSIALASFLNDPDHDLSDLQLSFSQETNLSVTQQGDDLVITPVPLNYQGPASFNIRAEDPDGFYDRKTISFDFNEISQSTFTVTIPAIDFDEDRSYAIWMDTCVAHSDYSDDQISWSFSAGSDLDYDYDAAARMVTVSSAVANWSGQSSITATATAPNNASRNADVEVTVAPVNDAPVANINSLNIEIDPANNLIDLKDYAVDVDNDPEELSWSFWGFSHFNFEWANAAQKIVRIVPLDTVRNESGFFRVADPANAADTAQVAIHVTGIPVYTFEVNIPDKTFPEDQLVRIQLDTTVTITYFNPAQLNWSFDLDPDLKHTFNSATRVLTIESRVADWSGDGEVTATATAPDQNSESATFQVTVTPVNDPPSISMQQLFVSNDPASNLVDLKDYAVDVDHSALQLDWNFWGFSEFDIAWEDAAQKIIQVVPLVPNASESGFFRVVDPGGAADTAQVQIQVNTSGQVFIVQIPDVTVPEDGQFDILMDTTLTVSGYSPAEIGWSFTPGANLGYSFNAASRKLSIFSQQPDWYGSSQMTAVATAPDLTSRVVTFAVTVAPVNDPPLASLQDLFVSENSNNLYDLRLYAGDVDNDVLDLDWSFWGFSQFTIEWANAPGKIIRIIPQGTPGSESGFFRVADPSGAADTAQVTITFLQDNTAPHLQFHSQLVLAEDSSLTLELVHFVVDSTNNAGELTWQFDPGAHLNGSFDPAGMTYTLFPDDDWSGNTTLRIVVQDPDGLSDSQQMAVLVDNRNDLRSVAVQNTGDFTADFTVQTDLPSRLDLSYWLDLSQVITVSNNSFRLSHSINLINLAPDTTYHFALRVTDEEGRSIVIRDSTFQTGMRAASSGTLSKDNLIVYPNPLKPAQGHREMIFTNLPENANTVGLYSLVGERVLEEPLPSTVKEFRLGILDSRSDLPSGLYIYMVKDARSKVISTGKIVVIR